MRHPIGLALMIGIATGALMMVTGDRGYGQNSDPNAAPNPYRMLDSWAQLPADRKFGGVIKVQVDHSDGKSMWVFDRCGSTECTNSTLAPLMKFDASGKFEEAIDDVDNARHGDHRVHGGHAAGERRAPAGARCRPECRSQPL